MRASRLGQVTLAATLAFLYAPILVLIAYSFNASRFSARWTGFTFDWYGRLFDSAETLSALRNTLVVSTISTVVATILGTLLAIGIQQYQSRGRSLIELLIYLPVVVPDIVIGVATLALYVTIGFPLGRTSIILAHIAFQISFVTLVVRARLQDFPRAIVDAARDLGASQLQTLRFVLLPLLRPGILAGALFAFALSIDDFVVTYFTAGAGASTMSIRIYSMIKRGVTPDVNALSTLLLGATLLLLAMATRSRRKAVVAPLLLLILAGCSGGDARGEGAVEAYGATVQRDSLAPELHLYTWSDYLDPELQAEFETTYGVKLVLDYYDTNEALIAKLQAGGLGQYDLIVASDYAVEVLRDDSLLVPLNHARIPNIANLDPRFRDMPFDPGNRYTVAYQWGTSGLGIRSDLITVPAGTELDTWGVVFDPASQVGPFLMMADARETIGAALIYLGYSANTVNPTELAAAEELLVAQRSRVLTYAPFANGRDLLASGDVAVAHNFSGDIMMAQEEVEGITYVIPREGAILWTDNMAIPAQAPSQYTAEAFINFIMDGEVGARLSNFNMYASPNAAAAAGLDPELLNDRSVYPDSAVFEHLEILRDVGEARTMYDRIWTRLRAGG